MPYLKSDEEFAELRRLLKGYGMTGCRLARVIRKCESTARWRLDCPGTLTLHELSLICKVGHIPADELRGALKFQ